MSFVLLVETSIARPLPTRGDETRLDRSVVNSGNGIAYFSAGVLVVFAIAASHRSRVMPLMRSCNCSPIKGCVTPVFKRISPFCCSEITSQTRPGTRNPRGKIQRALYTLGQSFDGSLRFVSLFATRLQLSSSPILFESYLNAPGY